MELVNIEYTGPGKNPQDVSIQDSGLVTSTLINSQFGNTNDVLELHIYGENGQLLESDYDAKDYYPFLTNNPQNSTFSNIVLDPEKDVKSRGYNRGVLNIQYNFLNNLFNSSEVSRYWIKEISRSRTEIKLASQLLSDRSIKAGFDTFSVLNRSKNYYPIFYLNFGNNDFVVANNFVYTQDDQGGYLLIKLYEPLPSQYDVKTQLWIVEKVAESVNFDVNIEVQVEEEEEVNKLRGPNYNVTINTKNGQTTPYYNYNDLLVSPITSSFQKLNSYYQDKAISINVDFSNFSNFVKFSSAEERINNFVYKLRQIEISQQNILAQSEILGGPGNAIIASSASSAEQQIIDNIIKNFDVYEYYLYFESSSWAWPKSNLTQPYTLYSITSSQASNFLGSTNTVPTATTQSLLFSASYYDSTNKDILRNTAPQYIIDDPSNQPFVTFLDMIGQHFDNLWIYYKDVSNRFNATNNPDTGISLDLVSEALKGLGMQLYTNTNVSDNLYYTLFGINADGSLLPPTGSEKITAIGGKYVTSSLSTLSAGEIQQELYKRLYHNLPYLYKTKGTAQSIKSLISIFGIPDTMLTVKEFGGNEIGSLDGIIDLNSSNYKVNIVTGSGGIVTGSLTISSSILSPYTTIQYYKGDTRLNSTNLEIGFSPSDKVNNIITASLGTFSLDQLVGAPGYRYSSSYTPLVSASNAHFAAYTYENSVWEYIRLLKFYNNSLFKIIKDFVPARANVSTGIIVKSHMLERNKYARHEPTITFNDYSQSINILDVSADNGGSITGSTSWSGMVVTPLGLASYSSSKNQELYTGEYSGSNITATDGTALEQGDYISHITGAVETYNFGALYQNVSSSVRSTRFLDLDYTSDQIRPVNYGAITYSLDQLQIDNYSTYNNPSNPFSTVQDYNYSLKRSILPRYSGSSVISSTYNVYTQGDSSYGKTAAIDKIKYQYAYLVDIYSSSFQLPGRTKGQIKYIIDDDQNVLDLSKTNTNIFAVQNVFKSGEYADVSLFDYDPSNPYISKLNNSQEDFTIWESGYIYSPMLFNISGTSLNYSYVMPTSSTSIVTVPAYTTLTPSTNDYWTINLGNFRAPAPPGTSGLFGLTGSAVFGGNPSELAVLISFTITNTLRGGTFTGQFTIPAGTNAPYSIAFSTSPYSTPYNTWLISDGLTVTTTQQSYNPSAGSVTSTLYITSITDSNAFLLVENATSLLLSPTQSLNYRNIILNATQSGMDSPVFPVDINVMDLVRLRNTSSGWTRESEYRVKQVIDDYQSGSFNYVKLVLDRPLNPSDVSASAIPGRCLEYIILKRLQDETAVTFNYELPQAITSDGILFPQYIDEDVRDNAGNVIKALKQQNLI